jgi:SNF2 family DNA or RNA helicase
MASKVIMMDPWWNSASEQQAFCRVFRIGQNEETYMSRLCVKDTVDQRLVEMQQRKQKEIDGVMENDGEWKSKYVSPARFGCCTCKKLTAYQDGHSRPHAPLW